MGGGGENHQECMGRVETANFVTLFASGKDAGLQSGRAQIWNTLHQPSFLFKRLERSVVGKGSGGGWWGQESERQFS